MKIVWSYLVFISILSQVSAQTCCSGGVPVSSNIGFNSGDQGLLQLSLSADFNTLQTLYQGSEDLDDDLRTRRTQSYILRGAYNVTDRFGIEVFFPLVRQTRNIITNGGEPDFESTFGIGDPILLLSYDLVRSVINWKIAAGPQIPLGSYTQTNSRGLTLLEDLQPGSGAWDLVLFSSLEYQLLQRPTMSVYFNTIFSSTGVNSDSRGGLQSYEFGDDVQLIGGLNDQFLVMDRVVTGGLALRYRNASRDRINDMPGTGTGGEWLFARLSIGTEFYKKSSLTINLELPVSTFVNETQLSPDHVVNISWFKSFKLTNNSSVDSLIKF